MSGFFTIKETESIERPGGRKYTCISCGAYKACKTPRMQPYGEFKKRILIVGGSVEEVDDEDGKPFQSKYGRLLESTLRKLGINLFKDCLCINSCICCVKDKEGDKRDANNFEIECCRKSNLKVVEQYKPHLIIILGNSALFSLIGHRWQKDLGDIFKWRGWTIPDQDFKAWLCPVFDPKMVLDSKKEELQTIWELDLERALSKLEESVRIYKEPTITYLEENELPILEDIQSGFVAFDYETTGIKPHAIGHRIVCVSIATSEDHVYVFMMPTSRTVRLPFTDLLKNPNIGKVAQNMKFEHHWSTIRLRQPVVNWVWDTMLMTHVMDNRQGITGLKFQTYVQFGIVDYDSEVSPYLKSKDNKNANAINQIDELLKRPGGKEMLLKYCGYDSIFEYRLFLLQKELITDLPSKFKNI